MICDLLSECIYYGKGWFNIYGIGIGIGNNEFDS